MKEKNLKGLEDRLDRAESRTWSRAEASGLLPKRRRGLFVDLLLRFFFFLFQIVFLLTMSAVVFAGAGAASFWFLREHIRGEDVMVPDLTALQVSDAVARLHDAGQALGLRLETEEFNELPEGAIFWQFPPPGKLVKRGAVVRVRTSRGTSYISCPDLRGKDFLEANVALHQLDLSVGAQSRVPMPNAQIDVVVAQDPPPGTLLARSEPVSLLISTGPPSQQITMPDLTGMSLPAAESLAARAGIRIGRVEKMALAGRENGVIFAQEPSAGSGVAPGEMVKVRVVDNGGSYY